MDEDNIQPGTEVYYRPGEQSADIKVIIHTLNGEIADLYVPSHDFVIYGSAKRIPKQNVQFTWTPLTESSY